MFWTTVLWIGWDLWTVQSCGKVARPRIPKKYMFEEMAGQFFALHVWEILEFLRAAQQSVGDGAYQTIT